MSKVVDSIIGHAVGDAMGVPTEFAIREKLLKKPVVDMISSSKRKLPAGSWSDDTSMEVAIIESFVEKGEFDYTDIMQKWSDWLTKGEYTPNGAAFGVGRTCLSAIGKFNRGVTPLECGLIKETANGNGSLMRSLPIALYSYYKKLSVDKIIRLVNDISSLTHAHDISKLGCYIYTRYVMFLLDGFSKEESYRMIQDLDYSTYSEYAVSKYNRILKDSIIKYNIDDISSLGYVVDTLECALWIVLNANSYRETIIATTNIGNDTDTIGAIAGSIAGIIYGIDSIPKAWLDELKRKEYLLNLANDFDELL